ncbi:MAG: glycosyltransferase [Patescibacteria group bacterium]
MKIWAHTLFKNEERWLWSSVSSVIDHEDKLLLWDTGSTDRSWDIAKEIKNKYKDKIDLKQYGEVTTETFPKVRQEMLDKTDSDWFLVVDADEIWWEDSMKTLISEIKKEDNNNESFVVPTVNVVGDIFHYQEESAGKYRFGNLKGHFNLRAVKRNIKGLHSQGIHGVWGWADGDNKQIQERNTFQFVNAPYLHTTFLPRGKKRVNDLEVPKRERKLKYEIGEKFPLDYYYPESFFINKPDFISSPWAVMPNGFRFRSFLETPFKKIKRRFFNKNVGY